VDAAQVEAIKQAMLSGAYDFSSAAGRVGGWVNNSGNYMIGEGHHRMTAAMQAGTSYVQKLI